MERDLVEKNLSERIAFKLANKISNEAEIDELKFKKMKYGLEVLIINLSKIVLILVIAEILGIFKETLFIMLSFSFIRCYAFGMHAKSSTSCTVTTSICFFTGVYISKILAITNDKVLLMLFGTALLLYLYAPADTEARPLVGRNLRKRLKIKALLSAGILMILALCINNSALKFCISYGVLCESITITPIIYKLFGRRYKNYERYKKVIC
ncbi:accessory gene regulator B family protein [Clostridium sp.]|uniref:accessory gene regulator B family protein n=1 Tax=Clostridium sp. TaxID=1506 RepID=UPI00283C82DB|nr:accessory gene regulator B family protein [Clostridium sp.]MDR3596036.1 accessory gene regulator B family protein [Clostridium sp.]